MSIVEPTSVQNVLFIPGYQQRRQWRRAGVQRPPWLCRIGRRRIGPSLYPPTEKNSFSLRIWNNQNYFDSTARWRKVSPWRYYL